MHKKREKLNSELINEKNPLKRLLKNSEIIHLEETELELYLKMRRIEDEIQKIEDEKTKNI